MLNRPADNTEVGEVVTAVGDYAAAQKTVSQLIAAEVPAREIAIVGQGVRTIERVTGRLGYASAARGGAINGMLIGLFLSALLVIGNPEAPMQLFVGFLLIGVALGLLLSLITYAIVRRRRDFASVTQIAAERYEVTVMPASLAKARQALGHVRAVPKPVVDLSEPPRYGERLPAGVDPASVARSPAPASTRAPASAPAPGSAPAEPAPGHLPPAPPPPPLPEAEAVPTDSVTAPAEPAHTAEPSAPENAAPHDAVDPSALEDTAGQAEGVAPASEDGRSAGLRAAR